MRGRSWWRGSIYRRPGKFWRGGGVGGGWQEVPGYGVVAGMVVSFSSIVGTVGVTLLLGAYFLHLFGFISRGRLYILLNIKGAGLSCYASVLIRYWPFVVLEGSWAFELCQSCVPRFSSFVTFVPWLLCWDWREKRASRWNKWLFCVYIWPRPLKAGEKKCIRPGLVSG
jgi:hypothetical protein